MLKTLLCPSLVLLVALTGCRSDDGANADVSYGAIIDDMTPELKGLTEREVDFKTHRHQAANINSRLFWEDWDRVFHWDHPSRLSPLPVGNISAQPR